MPKLALLTAVGGPIELAEFPLSTPAPETAALKLRMAGICGSDLHIFRGELPLPCPYAMGHEMVGEIAELGEGLTTDATGKPLAVGDRVVTPYFWFCGQCHACAHGRLVRMPEPDGRRIPHARAGSALRRAPTASSTTPAAASRCTRFPRTFLTRPSRPSIVHWPRCCSHCAMFGWATPSSSKAPAGWASMRQPSRGQQAPPR